MPICSSHSLNEIDDDLIKNLQDAMQKEAEQAIKYIKAQCMAAYEVVDDLKSNLFYRIFAELKRRIGF